MAQLSDASRSDAATDAAQLLSRIGYAALAVATPSAATLSSRAMFVLFPVGVALLLVAATLDPVAGVGTRLRALAASPVAWAAVALFAWACLSLLWTPFPIPGAQRLLKIAMTALAAAAVIVTARDHLRATDLYLFPIGVLMLMATIFALWFAEQQTLEPDSRAHRRGRNRHGDAALPGDGRAGGARPQRLRADADAARPDLRLRHRLGPDHRGAARRHRGAVLRRLRPRTDDARRRPGGGRGDPCGAAAARRCRRRWRA